MPGRPLRRSAAIALGVFAFGAIAGRADLVQELDAIVDGSMQSHNVPGALVGYAVLDPDEPAEDFTFVSPTVTLTATGSASGISADGRAIPGIFSVIRA